MKTFKKYNTKNRDHVLYSFDNNRFFVYVFSLFVFSIRFLAKEILVVSLLYKLLFDNRIYSKLLFPIIFYYYKQTNSE